jgi:hypothetical protein
MVQRIVVQVGEDCRGRVNCQVGERDTHKVWGPAGEVQREDYMSKDQHIYASWVLRMHDTLYAKEN